MRALKRLLLILGALVALIVACVLVALVEVEWQARAAARAGAALLHAELVVPAAPPAQPSLKPVLILLHGAGLNRRMWDPVVRHLDPAYRVIALDLPGHGAHGDEVFSLDGAAAEVVAAARSVAPAPVVLVGDSLGGFSAMAAAPYLPRAQLAGLVLAGSTGNLRWPEVARTLAQSFLVRAVFLFSDPDKLAARALALVGLTGTDAHNVIKAGMSFRAIGPAARSLLDVDFRARLAGIEAPVLIVNGSLDRPAVAQEASFVAAARHATSVRFENCEHGVSLRRPAEFAAVVSAFAKRVSQPPSS